MAVSLSQVDFKKLAPRELGILIASALLALGYGYYEFEYKVQTDKIKKLQTQLVEADTALNRFMQALKAIPSMERAQGQIEKLKEEKDELREDIVEIRSRLKGKDFDVLSDLQSEAEAFGISIQSIRTKEREVPRGGLKLKEVSLIMVLHSDYESLVKFMVALETYPAVLSVRSLGIERNIELLPKIESRLHIKIYVL